MLGVIISIYSDVCCVEPDAHVSGIYIGFVHVWE